ncbi:hypothetical protein [Luteolibacter rhizosphaerae]|nr:hypothetical protein [Luteolibacter rhizosphaerae]
MMRPFSCLALALLLPSCGFKAVNAARSDYRQGLAAEQAGDLARAREHQFAYHRQALLLDRPFMAAQATYEYARLSGYAGDHRAADEAFRSCLEHAGKDPETRLRLRYVILIEYARFLHDQGRHREAIGHYQQAISLVTPSNLQARDPIGFAEFLEEYAVSLSHSGKRAEATNARSWAAQLRRDHPGKKADYPRRHYPRTLQPGQRIYDPKGPFPKANSPEAERRRFSPSVTPQSE